VSKDPHFEVKEKSARDYRAFFDSKVLRSWHLPEGKDVVVTIESIAQLDSTHSGQPKSQLLMRFRKAELPMACNKTNCATIAAMYGNDPTKWVGKRIALYATTTRFGGAMVDCIRVRPTPPTPPTPPATKEPS
jgi:hypothetical protein